MSKKANYSDLKEIVYSDAWDLQKELFQRRKAEEIPDTILFLSHPHTYTIGKTGLLSHLLESNEELEKQGIHFERIDRGGDITYHGPGQMVVYPIIDLNQHFRDVHLYLRKLEDVLIHFLSAFAIHASRSEGMTGVWVNDEKIAAIGVKVSRWITMHGLALNVNTDLSFFDKIVPCGISDKKVTSMERILERKVSMDTVLLGLLTSFSEIFHFDLKKIDMDILLNDYT